MRGGGGPEAGPQTIYARIGGVAQVTPSALRTGMDIVSRPLSPPAGY